MLGGLDVDAAIGEAELPPLPNHAERLRAWRLWAVEHVGGAARLRSLYQPCLWPTRAPFAARCRAQHSRLWCRSPHEAPVDTCSCGIYAVGADRIPRLWRNSEPAPRFPLAIGIVSLWGGVVECEHGWRAGLAYPREIFIPHLASGSDETVSGLEDYGVPVEMLGARTIGTALEAVAERTV